MHRALIELLFKIPRTSVGRIAVGIFLAAGIAFVGLRGLADGEVWIPSDSMREGGMKFGRYAGMSASFGYLFGALFVHYVGFWRAGKLEELRKDTLTLLLAAACAVAVIGFFVLALLDI